MTGAVAVDEATNSGSSVITTSELAVAAWTASLGSALEYYDFALYSLASALIFTPLFFPGQAPGIGLLASFATYFVGFAVRPIGGIVFGALGDRLGRKFVLLATILLMGLSSTAIGLLPTFEQAGFVAPTLLVLCRIMQGLGAGAEQAGAAVLMTEYAPKGRRGFFASLPFMGIQIGTIIAALVYFVLLYSTENIADSWLWRLPFLGSVLILAVAVWMRLRLKESPTFKKLKAHEQDREHPLRALLLASKRPILIGIGLRLAENGGSSIYQALAVSYLVGTMGLPRADGSFGLIVAAILGAITVPIAGALTDRFGRRPVYRSFAILQFVLAIPTWWAFSQGGTTLSLTFLAISLGIGAWGMFGAQGALMPELFGARHRYLGVSMAREISAVIAGGIAPLIGSALIAATIALHPDDARGVGAWLPIALYLMILTAGTIWATFLLPETRDRDLDAIEDATAADRAG
ncbi:MFS transporter, MHS family, metabolite:H+ symporter [Arboricoccus pini]|uniref:MFS transporter, MHS family, metabolite:H+ symporter n=1 Tax=Arboricoccus pini TaxID=1963835 RepID=A0A212QS78_9PROT|nr:MFS transporter [Arboricoccus pini]SNB62432.1 MFS transporter, MHS family, metabolite:H+ symporter [Arboricoccus pini]